jgi:hypothetical protein
MIILCVGSRFCHHLSLSKAFLGPFTLISGLGVSGILSVKNVTELSGILFSENVAGSVSLGFTILSENVTELMRLSGIYYNAHQWRLLQVCGFPATEACDFV